MNFLIISDYDAVCKILKNTSKDKFFEKSLKFTKCSFDTVCLKKMFKKISDFTACIIFSSNQNTINQFSQDQISLISLISGYLFANDIQLITNIPFIFDNFSSKNKFLISISDETELLTYITKNLKKVVQNSIKTEAKLTLQKKGIPFTPDCFGTYIAKNKEDICNLFIEAGININSCDDNGIPMLNIAVRNDNEELTKKFLALKADINIVSKDRGYTPLMDAVWKGNKELTKLLISKGADLNTISKEGQSNLVLAVGADRVEICRLLAQNGANPDIKDQMGMSAYGYASLFRKKEILEILSPYHTKQ